MNKYFSLIRVPKDYLLIITAFVWTIAGLMLLIRGYSSIKLYPEFLAEKIIGSFVAGIVFFMVVFTRITAKHLKRIINMQNDFPYFFNFFNFRSYFMLVLMITMGISMRKSGIIAPENIAIVYLTMGIPLLLSSVKFYSSFIQKFFQLS